MTPADVLFIGEAPGPSEDTVGKPFVGPAGDLFDDILEDSGIEPLTYSITNVIACFPDDGSGGVRAPKKSEVLRCFPRLIQFIKLVKPSTIISVGSLAEKTVKDWIEPDLKLDSVDGYYKPLYTSIIHPSYMLRTGGKSSVAYPIVVTNLRYHWQLLKRLKGW